MRGRSGFRLFLTGELHHQETKQIDLGGTLHIENCKFMQNVMLRREL